MFITRHGCQIPMAPVAPPPAPRPPAGAPLTEGDLGLAHPKAKSLLSLALTLPLAQLRCAILPRPDGPEDALFASWLSRCQSKTTEPAR